MRTGVPCERPDHSGEPHRRFALGDGVAEAARDDLTELTGRLVVLRRTTRVLGILPVRDDRLGMSRHGVGDRGGGHDERVDREPCPDDRTQDSRAPAGVPKPDESKKGEA